MRMKTKNWFKDSMLVMTAVTLIACGGSKDEEGVSEAGSKPTMSEVKVEISQWDDSTQVMNDLGFTSKFQYAEMRRGSLYIFLSDTDLGDNYLSSPPDEAQVIQLVANDYSGDGDYTGDYGLDTNGTGQLAWILRGDQQIVCCGHMRPKYTVGKIHIEKCDKTVVNGSIELDGFDSTRIVVTRFSAPMMDWNE